MLFVFTVIILLCKLYAILCTHYNTSTIHYSIDNTEVATTNKGIILAHIWSGVAINIKCRMGLRMFISIPTDLAPIATPVVLFPLFI